jgi:predicted transcriptional regulator
MTIPGTLNGITIKYNSVQCKQCGEIIVSRNRHKRVYCKCKKIYIAGGLKQFVRGGDLDSMLEFSVPIPRSLYTDTKGGVMSPKTETKKPRKQRRSLSYEDKKKVEELFAKGETRTAIAKIVDSTPATVSRYILYEKHGLRSTKGSANGQINIGAVNGFVKIEALKTFIEGLRVARELMPSTSKDYMKGWDEMGDAISKKIDALK